jgi:hypothetical protein
MTVKIIHADSMKDLITDKVFLHIGHLHHKNSYNSDFGSNLNEHEEHLAKIFGKLPSHVKASGCILRVTCLLLVISQITVSALRGRQAVCLVVRIRSFK